MIPYAQALSDLGLDDTYQILPVLSGYPSPKYINLVLRRDGGSTYLFETSANRQDIVDQVDERLSEQQVERLDAVLLTHCHGDHGGAAGIVSGRGRPDGERAPIHLHSAGYRFLTQPAPSFLQETYEIFLARAQWGLLDYSTLSDEEILKNAIRMRFSNYFDKVGKPALRFVDHGQLPEGIEAVYTPGHSYDCVLYFDTKHGIAVPGDTIITTGKPEDSDTHAYVVPIFTVAGQVYSMAYERYLRTIAVLRKFFSEREVKAILPPHGRFAVTEPMAWVTFAENYFEGIYSAFRDEFIPEKGDAPFLARDLSPYVPTAGAHPISTPSHTFGMLCLLSDDGYLDLEEDVHTRQLSFSLREEPPRDWVTELLAKDPGPLPVYRC